MIVQNPHEVFAAALFPSRVQESGFVPQAMNVATTDAPAFLKSLSRRSPKPHNAIESPMIRTGEGIEVVLAAITRGTVERTAAAPNPVTKRLRDIGKGVDSWMGLTRSCVSKDPFVIQL